MMCPSESKMAQKVDRSSSFNKINGRPVLQPKSNQVIPTLERQTSLKKNTKPNSTITNSKKGRVLSPKPKTVTTRPSKDEIRVENCGGGSSAVPESPGSLAAARKEHAASMQEQRKSKIAQYGILKSSVVPIDSTTNVVSVAPEKKCAFITPNSDPIYVAYHDEEWGVPVHNDELLFELLVLTSIQVGSDWTSVLKKRQALRDAFSRFDPEIVAKFHEKTMTSIRAQYGLDKSQVRGIVDNSSIILKVRREFGTFDKYLWGFVNYKPMCTEYKSTRKMPVKTSKSDSISKDMVKRGFRFVGPTVIHSFMQAVGLTNDHLFTCPRHHHCKLLASL